MIGRFIDEILVDIPENALSTNRWDVRVSLCKIFESVSLRAHSADGDPFDDVAYAPYKVNGCFWTSICVQDFDIKDYVSYWFLIDDCPVGDVFYDAVRVPRQRVYKAFEVDISTADALTNQIVSEICKYLV